jgi:diguanylate cyclase
LKTINDAYGHEIGTRAIQTVCKCARHHFRKVVLLPRSEADEAHHIAKRILEQINKSAFKHIPLRIGASIGIATFDNKLITDRKSLLSAADSALYSAKQTGKNRINIFCPKSNKKKRLIANPGLPPATSP